MNEELQKALLSILNSTINAATAAKEFLIAETPEVVRQLLMWKAAEAAVISFALLIGVALVVVPWWKNRKWCLHELGPLNFFPGFAVFILLFFALGNFLIMLQIIIAPKIYLLEYAASLVK